MPICCSPFPLKKKKEPTTKIPTLTRKLRERERERELFSIALGNPKQTEIGDSNHSVTSVMVDN